MDGHAEFSNSYIQTNELPQVEELTFEPLSPKYRKTNAILNTVIFIVLATLLAFFKVQTFFDIADKPNNVITIILSMLTVFTLFSLVFQFFADACKSYSLREQDISFSSGLIFKKTVTQPILRIQHVELKQGPIDRKVNLAKIQVFSAGGAMHTFEIPGLTLSNAEAIRQFILEHKDVKDHG